jgi:6,7-dimethyl-8-ribityllumazine synthase
MRVKISLDVEEECRAIIARFINAYCKIPESYELPFICVSQVGGSENDTIYTHSIVIEGYASGDEEANTVTRKAIGILKAVAENQRTPIRYVVNNTDVSRYMDPVRPDLSRYRATVLVTTHQIFDDVEEL